MSRLFYVRAVCVVTAFAWCGAREAETFAAAEAAAVGREDPFAQLPRPKAPKKIDSPVFEEISIVPFEEPKPKLFAETFKINYIDAKSLMEAIGPMSGKYGKITVDQKSNSLIVCDTQENLEQIMAEISKADKYTAGLLAETVTLRFLDAANLKAALDGMSSQYGKISVDTATNSLIVCDTEDRLRAIVAEIRKADKKPPQILIEAVIADVQLSDDTEIGVNWGSLFAKDYEGSFQQSLVTTLATAGTTGADLSILKADLSGTLHALQETRNVEILASPRVLVVSGQEAQIKTIEEIPYEEVSDSADGGAAALTSIEFKEVGITLKVKATVTDDSMILLQVEPEQSASSGEAGVQDVPIVDSRSAKTTVLIADGQVVVIGGLRRKDTKLSRDKVPIIGDLPVIGFFFSRSQEVVEQSELMVFISPHIYTGQPPTDEQLRKFNELRDLPMLDLPLESEPSEAEKLMDLVGGG
jgi:type II secretory pathway component GspD/PulD (secretin)